jgi:RNase P subunit RPR2
MVTRIYPCKIKFHLDAPSSSDFLFKPHQARVPSAQPPPETYRLDRPQPLRPLTHSPIQKRLGRSLSSLSLPTSAAYPQRAHPFLYAQSNLVSTQVIKQMPCPACNDALTYGKDFTSPVETVADLERYATTCRYCGILLSLVKDCRPELMIFVRIRADTQNRCTKGVIVFFRYRDGVTQRSKEYAICNLLGMFLVAVLCQI